MSALSEVLIHLLFEARATKRLAAELKRVRDSAGLSSRDLRVTGSQTHISESTRFALEEGLLTEQRLAQLVDQAEENGRQHIFLFDLTVEGQSVDWEAALNSTFKPAPSPALALYSSKPEEPLVYFRKETSPDGFVVKHISTASYWEKSERESEETKTRRVVVHDRVQRRAVSLFRVDPARGWAEIRIDRVRSLDDREIAKALLTNLFNALEPAFSPMKCLRPVPIWRAFQGIIEALDETYMATDDAQDASINVKLSNRREGIVGGDIRDHPKYEFGTEFTRKNLNIFWLIDSPDKEKPSRIHTILSGFEFGEWQLGKAYVAARVALEDLDHVIGRIRHFAGEEA